ncbi:baculoviral IAP repeat-containing protein 7-A [Caerostris darwini]|uniref:Baculoviral IAP repeat-containing protein 7-A n=1 Tax=Caerostris darwini TaxID=1538125 RepID=A0AAV4TA47_9ARAC|nr:baculoviral IAP repeat-containing protein 7-A [Caerostris darwini]
MGRWPRSYVKLKDLAKNSFFYLLSEDSIQCAFCSIIIDDWNVSETPLKKHTKKAPKCPFLMASNVGNIPMQKQKPVEKSLSKLIPNTKSNSTSLSGQAKYPRMTELKNRLATYKHWPLMMLSPRQLSECGLFYTGIACRGLKGKAFYTMACSTSEHNRMRILSLCSFPSSLQFLCCNKVRELIPDDKDVLREISLLAGLKTFLENHLDWFLKSRS